MLVWDIFKFQDPNKERVDFLTIVIDAEFAEYL